MEYFSLADYREEIQRCMRCGFCKALCPTGEFSGWETSSPRGRMQMLRGILNGEIQASNYLMEKIYECGACGYCLWKCPSGVKTTDAVKAARNYLMNKKMCPPPVKKVRFQIEKTHSIQEPPANGRTAWIKQSNLEKTVKAKRKADIVYFVGCYTSMSNGLMNIATATSLIFNEAGLDWTVLGEEEWCCGSPLSLSGAVENLKDIASHNVAKIREKGAKMLVTSCARCYRMFTQEYPKLIGDLGFDVNHTSQLIEKMIGQNKIRFNRNLNMVTVYHDPCELGRHSKIYDSPRKVLRSIPGVKLLEMPRNHELTRCCGGGSILRETNPEIAYKLAVKKLEEAKALSVDAIVSACPNCKLNIADAVAKHNSSIRMLDITEAVTEAIQDIGKQK